VPDLVAGVSRPVKELTGFQRGARQPGESQIVRFEVPAPELGFIGGDMQYVLEPGTFRI
jgi:beta-glucosidase